MDHHAVRRLDAVRFSTKESVLPVARRMSVHDPREAERAARAVLVTLREAVSERELRDLLSQLPKDMRRLFSPRAA